MDDKSEDNEVLNSATLPLTNKEIAQQIIDRLGDSPTKDDIRAALDSIHKDARRHVARYIYGHYQAADSAVQATDSDRRSIILGDLYERAHAGDNVASRAFLDATRDDITQDKPKQEDIDAAIVAVTGLTTDRAAYYRTLPTVDAVVAEYLVDRDKELQEIRSELLT